MAAFLIIYDNGMTELYEKAPPRVKKLF